MAQVSFSGNIGKYHGLKFSNDGKARASFSVAETAREKNQQSGQWEDGGTTWFNVTLFGRAAEALDAAIPDGKGRVHVSGRMKTRVFDHNGEKRESLDVVADEVGIIPRNQNSGQQQGQVPAHNGGGWGGNQSASDPWAAPQGQSDAAQWGNGPTQAPGF